VLESPLRFLTDDDVDRPQAYIQGHWLPTLADGGWCARLSLEARAIGRYIRSGTTCPSSHGMARNASTDGCPATLARPIRCTRAPGADGSRSGRLPESCNRDASSTAPSFWRVPKASGNRQPAAC
jgi:hypothetical protein